MRQHTASSESPYYCPADVARPGHTIMHDTGVVTRMSHSTLLVIEECPTAHYLLLKIEPKQPWVKVAKAVVDKDHSLAGLDVQPFWIS